MPRTFYGFEHDHGPDLRDRRGRRLGQVYGFATVAARDRWMNLGAGAGKAREAIAATSPEVRSALRADYWTVLDGDAMLAERDTLEARRDALADRHARKRQTGAYWRRPRPIA